jgi:uncharacterized protein
LIDETPLETILGGLDDVYTIVQQASGVTIRYSREDRKKHENSHTFYLAYEGPMPSASLKEAKVDITIRERIVLPIQERPVLKEYYEYADLPEDSNIFVYALDEILVEKVVALMSVSRSGD